MTETRLHSIWLHEYATLNMLKLPEYKFEKEIIDGGVVWVCNVKIDDKEFAGVPGPKKADTKESVCEKIYHFICTNSGWPGEWLYGFWGGIYYGRTEGWPWLTMGGRSGYSRPEHRFRLRTCTPSAYLSNTRLAVVGVGGCLARPASAETGVPNVIYYCSHSLFVPAHIPHPCCFIGLFRDAAMDRMAIIGCFCFFLTNVLLDVWGS